MNKNNFAVTPPMGWNSYDYYDTTVTESDLKANADYMSEHLLEYGWEYIVVDIQWYAYHTGTQRNEHQYIPFSSVAMDDFGRLLPCPDRFPSSKDGAGFRPLADYVHARGLKFGIHIMRGIPRIAAHNHCPILGTTSTANQIANPTSICWWNPDMYGVNPNIEASQTYYDSLFALYAEWGVDFIKCDDICRMDMPSAKREIEMLHNAIMKCGRPMVLSLSPGPAKIEEAWHYEKFSNMWRITDDLWDRWPLILQMFDRCELWYKHVSTGCYPDCDMLPLGKIGKGFWEERSCALTPSEQISMMTLWCMFRSPLMLGCELTQLDPWTVSLITNTNVLRLLSHSKDAKPMYRCSDYTVWYAKDCDNDSFYLAIFHFVDDHATYTLDTTCWGLPSSVSYRRNELWTNDRSETTAEEFVVDLEPHGAKLYRCTSIF